MWRKVWVTVLVFAAMVLFSRSRAPLPVPPRMLGIWDSGCRPPEPGQVAPWRLFLNLADGEFTEYLVYFRGEACTDAHAVTRSIGSFKLPRSRGHGELEVDWQTTNAWQVCLVPLCAKQASENKLYGLSAWQVGKEVEITGKPTQIGETVDIKTGLVEYGLAKLINKGLLFGAGGSQPKRPLDRPRVFDDASLAYRKVANLPSYLPK